MSDDLPKQNAETYLGDGLYASFDGFNVILRAPSENGDHFVGLESRWCTRAYVRGSGATRGWPNT